MTVDSPEDTGKTPAGSRIEERWLDTGSGPGRTVQVEVYDCVDEDPETAYRRILDHGMDCPTCRTVDADGRANGDCDIARRLNLAWGMARRQTA
ncbi:hypothetical protein [Streptomyces sp. ATCC 21386]|uniref:hypothetical protein n=1 Tax=Streptomyces sp. ATCC 21386 TaxID=2699428 RepID=UPI001BFF4776|nr:hypothetical protein [Streptomyces sp. ATCC 21386]